MIRLTDRLDMTIANDRDVKSKTKQNKNMTLLKLSCAGKFYLFVLMLYVPVKNFQSCWDVFLVKPVLSKGLCVSFSNEAQAGPHSAVGNVSGNRCVSDCRSRGRQFDPSPVQYFRGD